MNINVHCLWQWIDLKIEPGDCIIENLSKMFAQNILNRDCTNCRIPTALAKFLVFFIFFENCEKIECYNPLGGGEGVHGTACQRQADPLELCLY